MSCMMLIANFAVTLGALDTSGETHVSGGNMLSLNDRIMQTENPETFVKDGALVLRETSKGTMIGTTALVLSKYMLSSRIPNNYLVEHEYFTKEAGDGMVAKAAVQPLVENRVRFVLWKYRGHRPHWVITSWTTALVLSKYKLSSRIPDKYLAELE